MLWPPKEVSSCGEVFPQSRLAGAARIGDAGAAKRKDPDRTNCSRYDGPYHEIFNEPEQDKVIGDVVKWTEGHL